MATGRDTEGYAQAARTFDSSLPQLQAAMRTKDDVMIITADHGNDPTFQALITHASYAPLCWFMEKRAPRS